MTGEEEWQKEIEEEMKKLSESYSMNSRSFFSVLVVSSKISIDNKSFNNISKDLEGRQRYSRVSFHV